ncbi:hypothetical protein Pelo_10562 [Pelomyxa schiedti]|nr:hypothetical protein Pelo_10562 [Pelomyxa schiedti]
MTGEVCVVLCSPRAFAAGVFIACSDVDTYGIGDDGEEEQHYPVDESHGNYGSCCTGASWAPSQQQHHHHQQQHESTRPKRAKTSTPVMCRVLRIESKKTATVPTFTRLANAQQLYAGIEEWLMDPDWSTVIRSCKYVFVDFHSDTLVELLQLHTDTIPSTPTMTPDTPVMTYRTRRKNNRAKMERRTIRQAALATVQNTIGV